MTSKVFGNLLRGILWILACCLCVKICATFTALRPDRLDWVLTTGWWRALGWLRTDSERGLFAFLLFLVGAICLYHGLSSFGVLSFVGFPNY
jgi:hypothetical protein